MIKIIAATLLILLPDAFAFAAAQTADWETMTCKDQRSKKVMRLMSIDHQSYAVAMERTESEFKICICSRGDEAKIAVDALVDSHEIELLLSEPVRTITTSIEYGRDFNIMFYDGNKKCYITINKTELCKNSGFISDAKSYFDVPLHYDEDSNMCVVELDHKAFKAEN